MPNDPCEILYHGLKKESAYLEFEFPVPAVSLHFVPMRSWTSLSPWLAVSFIPGSNPILHKGFASLRCDCVTTGVYKTSEMQVPSEFSPH